VHVDPSGATTANVGADQVEGRIAQSPSEQLVAHSLARYRAIFEHSMDAVLLTAPDGRIAMSNAATTTLFGFSEEELRQQGRQAIVDETDPRLDTALRERVQTGHFRGELTMKRKDGSRVEVEVSSAVFRDELGTEWTSMFIRDITERSRLEAGREQLRQALDAERRWLRAVLDHVPAAVILLDVNGNITFNARAEAVLGGPLRPELGNAQYRERILFPDGTRVPEEELFSTRVLRNGETIVAGEYLIESRDGSRIPVLGSAAPIRDATGGIIGAVAVLQDMSERMQVEGLILSSEQLLNGIFELLPVGVWVADRTGRIVRGNPAGVRIWGGARYVSPTDFGEFRATWADTGKPIAPEDWALTRAITKGETSIGEVLRIQCFDGSEKTILNSALPLYDERKEFAGAIVVNEDITALKQTEAALRDAIQSREHLLGVVAHDLRTPLQVIVLQAEALLRLSERRAEHREIMERIRAQSKRIHALIRDLLDVTRIESGALPLAATDCDPKALLTAAWETSERLADQASITLVLDVESGLPRIDADAPRIEQVLDNLIGNAIKFTPAGGTVTIGARARGSDVEFQVSDTGRGMSDEMMHHVFDRLWQSGTDHRGIGLGLAIAKAIIEAHGGRIWATSTVGSGSTFSFTLPARADAIDSV
jgi:PAS domain S-box-containing protein